jgi:hypothetical protein
MRESSSRVNFSLAAFSRFISGSLMAGVGSIVLSLGLIFSGSLSAQPNIGLVGFGIFCMYLGVTLLGLSLAGWFLRQTARTIVEGLGGNLFESAPGAARVQNATPQDAIVSKLRKNELEAWIAAGSPSTASWVDPDETFLTWLSRQK